MKLKTCTRIKWPGAVLKCTLILVLMNLWVIPLFGQTVPISGVVKSELDNEPLPGVNVTVKGTIKGTVTDVDGKYSLEVPSPETVLVFSFIGFATEEVVVGNKSTIDVTMASDITGLEEVVVVGYGTQQKKLVTGSTIQVKSEDILKMNTTNALDALKGQSPGVSISSASAQPGEGYKISIRGLGTVGNATPLYIVDGVQTGDISYLNPADIESIDVLKDAASAAIYGSRAANGVILVTTKKGKAGKPQITYDGYIGAQNLYKKMPYLNAREYAVIMNEQYLNSGQSAPFPTDEASMEALGEGTDWVDMLIKDNVLTQNHSFGISGGTDQSIYSLGFSYTDQGGIVGGKDKSYYDRYSLRINTEYDLIKDYVKVGQNFTYSNTGKSGLNTNGLYDNILSTAYQTTPLLEPYDEDGNITPTGRRETSPVLFLKYNYNNIRKEDKIVGNAYIDINPIKNLTLRSVYNVDFSSGTYRDYTPIYDIGFESINLESRVSQNSWTGKTFTWDNSANYQLQLGKNYIDVLGGMSVLRNSGERMWARKYGLLIDSFDYAWLSNAMNTPTTNQDITGAPYEKERLVSYFGRVNYNFDEKYLLTAIFRADGSSKFAKGNRWGYFPSISGGWNISNEPFMDGTGHILNYLKLRASWGQNGNQNIDNFRYMATLTTNGGGYSFGSTEGTLTTGIYADKLPNSNLKWETSEQTNVGFDARLLNHRLNLTFDYYNKKTKDWLVEAPVLDIMGAGAPFINAGNVENRGVEISLGFSDDIGDFNYSINANVAHNINEVTYIGNSSGFLEGGGNLLYTNANNFYRAEAGYPIGYFYGLKTAGIFQNEQEVEEWGVQPGAKPGDIKFLDLSGPEGVPDNKIDENDRTMIGNPHPDYIFGLSLSASYKAFDFTMVTNGAAGHQIAMGFLHNYNGITGNYHQVYLNRWHGEGTSNEWPRVTNNTEANKNWTYMNDLLIDNGDYLKIATLSLGYDFAKTFKSLPFQQLRLYFTGQNLYTFTNYLGMDPEVGFGASDNVGRNYSSGIDVGYYPHPRTYLVGLNVKF